MNKQMPYSNEAEQSVLGSIFFDPEISAKVINDLSEDDFYFKANAHIFSAIKAIVESNKQVDIISVKSMLDSRGLLDETGGIGYLSELTELLPSSVNIDTYISIVKSKCLLRQVIDACNLIKDEMINKQDTDVNGLLDYAEDKIYDITNQRNADNFDEIKEVLKEVMNTVELNRKQGQNVSGISSGYKSYDRLTLGFQKGELIILAARPAMGKSALAVNIAMNVARSNKHVAIFTLEMSSEQVALRMLSSTSRVDSRKLRGGELNNQDMTRVTAAKSELEKLDIYFEDSSGIKVSEVFTKCRQLKQQNKLDFVVVDYLQLLSGSANYGGNRVTEVSEISRKLKNLARDLEIPVVALSQLSRGVEKRDDKRPMLADLRESGSIEQDADIVMFLYRDGYYNPDENEPENNQEPVELILRKNRSGGLGTCDLLFVKSTGKFNEPNYSSYDDVDALTNN